MQLPASRWKTRQVVPRVACQVAGRILDEREEAVKRGLGSNWRHPLSALHWAGQVVGCQALHMGQDGHHAVDTLAAQDLVQAHAIVKVVRDA